ncbi:MAG: uracil phosphoribosyltransferase, partial [Oscillospiraceae bacterium]
MSKVLVFDHPLIQHKISILRDENTGTKEFKELISEVSMLMCYEATRNLPIKEVKIKTPIAEAITNKLDGRKLAFIPILRAGLGMTDGVMSLIPNAKIGHIGIYRDPETIKAIEYFCKLPKDIDKRDVIVLDPMLATGVSAIDAINTLKSKGCKNIKFMCIIAAPEGINALQKAHPDIEIYCGSKDKYLDSHSYIVPGLGDAGDR